MVLMLLVFLIAGALVANVLLYLGLVSAGERILVLWVILLPGLFIAGVYTSNRFAANYDEYAWGVTSFLTLAVFLSGFVCLLYFQEVGFRLSFFVFITYMFLLVLPTAIAAGFSTYEVLLSRRMKRSFSFHMKRFVGRMVLAEVLFVLVVAVSGAINSLSPFLPERYLIMILIFANLATGMVLYMASRNPRIGRFFRRLENGDW